MNTSGFRTVAVSAPVVSAPWSFQPQSFQPHGRFRPWSFQTHGRVVSDPWPGHFRPHKIPKIIDIVSARDVIDMPFLSMPIITIFGLDFPIFVYVKT